MQDDDIDRRGPDDICPVASCGHSRAVHVHGDAGKCDRCSCQGFGVGPDDGYMVFPGQRRRGNVDGGV